MPYRTPKPPENSLVHIYNRGNNRMTLFRTKTDFQWFIEKINRLNLYDTFGVIAFCLMPNHYHFLLKIKSENSLTKFFHRAQLAYAKYFNRKYGHRGHVFESRFKAKLITDDKHALAVCRYIHLNPVRSALVDKPELWDFSNLKDVFNPETKKIYREFYSHYFNTVREYKDFVNSGMEDRELQSIKSYLFGTTTP